MPMYNLLEYSKNYRKTIGSLYNYYRDELSDDDNNNNNNNNNNDNNNNNNNNNNFLNNNVVNSSGNIVNSIGNTYNVDSTIPNPAGGARIANPDYVANNSGKKM